MQILTNAIFFLKIKQKNTTKNSAILFYGDADVTIRR
jgi:hypothetical protein